MSKIDLIQPLKDSNGPSKSEAETIINLFFDKMAEALAQGERVEIQGLCSLSVKEYKAYTGRTPKPARRLRLHQRSYLFLRWARIGWMVEGKKRYLQL